MFRALAFLSVFFVSGVVEMAYMPRFPSPGPLRRAVSPYKYETEYFPQSVDHFGFNRDVGSFLQRYLITTEHWKPGKPIFFYAGNEGDITWFCNNTGFMWDIAPEFEAMLLFAEHRYYGESLPFGEDSYSDSQHLQYLSSEQVLADFAVLIEHVKATVSGADKSPVVAFGGSYGGMLAAWFRMKYPNVVVGAIAASAPIWQFTNLTRCSVFNEIVSKDYKMAGGDLCFENIKGLWEALLSAAEGEHGMFVIANIFDLCVAEFDVNVIADWLSSIFVNMAMVDYPYPASFLEPLPAWPVSEACSYLNHSAMNGTELLGAVAQVINLYFNHTGQATCFNVSSQGTSFLGDRGWDYQACTEMVMPMCSSKASSVFPQSSWSLHDYMISCDKEWNTTARLTMRPDWVSVVYGGKDITAHSNIVFSNGNLDPWSGGGVRKSLSDTLIAVQIEQGAHHLDLRAANPLDPESVIRARNLEKDNIRKWIET